MANVAFGCLSVKSEDGWLLRVLKRIAITHDAFSYESEPSCNFIGNELNITFCGAWSCRDAWDVLDGLLEDKSFRLRQSLIDSEITGYDEEASSELFTWVRKLPGENKITYSFPLEDLNINSLWDAFKLLIPYLPKVGTSIEVNLLENLRVTSIRTKMTKEHGSCVHYSISCDRANIAYKFAFYLTAEGNVIGTKYWCSDMPDAEDEIELYCIVNDSDSTYSICHQSSKREPQRQEDLPQQGND